MARTERMAGGCGVTSRSARQGAGQSGKRCQGGGRSEDQKVAGLVRRLSHSASDDRKRRPNSLPRCPAARTHAAAGFVLGSGLNSLTSSRP
jgi:hypothetical protein